VRRPREFSLRSRLLWLSVMVVTAGLAVGGVLLIGVLNFALLRAVNAEASDTAAGVVKLIEQHSLAEVIQVNPSMQVQVIDGRGRVLAISAGADRLIPMLHDDELRGLKDGDITEIPGDRIGLPGGAARVVMRTAGAPSNPVRVLVARSTADLEPNAVLHAELARLWERIATLNATGAAGTMRD